MAIKHIIVYFPWGAGGNFIKNICTLDTDFDWFDQQPFRPEVPPTQSMRYYFMLDYYSQRLEPNQWLEHEWSLRGKYLAKYYEAGYIKYWDPGWATAYEYHGTIEEIDSVTNAQPLQMFDRTKINRGEIVEQLSPWLLSDCRHVFLLPKDMHLITDIYQSKNPSLNQINPNGTTEARRKQAFIINRLMTLRLSELAELLQAQAQTVYKYTADELFTNTGSQLIESIITDLQLNIPLSMIAPIHQAWLTNTQQVYKKYWDKDLP